MSVDFEYATHQTEEIMEKDYSPGQQVVCINTESRHQCALRLGEVYTIKAKYQCSCGSNQLILEEMAFLIQMICQCGHTATRPQSYYEWRFRPSIVS